MCSKPSWKIDNASWTILVSHLGRILFGTFCFLQFLVGFKILFFWYCLPKTIGLESLPNLSLRELQHFADFARILALMCFLIDNFSFSGWSLRNLPKTVGPFFWKWKNSPTKSTGFRIQLLCTENIRYCLLLVLTTSVGNVFRKLPLSEE